MEDSSSLLVCVCVCVLPLDLKNYMRFLLNFEHFGKKLLG